MLLLLADRQKIAGNRVEASGQELTTGPRAALRSAKWGNDLLALQKFLTAHVRFGSKADIDDHSGDVRFTPKSRHC